jgi:hypothetical protein
MDVRISAINFLRLSLQAVGNLQVAQELAPSPEVVAAIDSEAILDACITYADAQGDDLHPGWAAIFSTLVDSVARQETFVLCRSARLVNWLLSILGQCHRTLDSLPDTVYVSCACLISHYRSHWQITPFGKSYRSKQIICGKQI